jgi:hypothetical protein
MCHYSRDGRIAPEGADCFSNRCSQNGMWKTESRALFQCEIKRLIFFRLWFNAELHHCLNNAPYGIEEILADCEAEHLSLIGIVPTVFQEFHASDNFFFSALRPTKG